MQICNGCTLCRMNSALLSRFDLVGQPFTVAIFVPVVGLVHCKLWVRGLCLQVFILLDKPDEVRW